MKRIAAAVLGCCLLILSACASRESSAPDTGGGALPTPPAQTAPNPLVDWISVFLEAKDLSYARALTRVETASPGDGTDLSSLFDGLRADLSEAEAPLYEAITVAFLAQQEEGDSWKLSAEKENGTISPEAKGGRTFSFTYGESGGRCTFSGRFDESSIQAAISQEVAGAGSYPLMTMACRKDGDGWMAQFWYTTDAGAGYRLVRYRFSQDRFRCGVWLDAAEPGELKTADADSFFSGAMTELDYGEDRLRVINDGEEYTL